MTRPVLTDQFKVARVVGKKTPRCSREAITPADGGNDRDASAFISGCSMSVVENTEIRIARQHRRISRTAFRVASAMQYARSKDSD